MQTETIRRHHGHLCADEDQIREKLERINTVLLNTLEVLLESSGQDGWRLPETFRRLVTDTIAAAKGT